MTEPNLTAVLRRIANDIMPAVEARVKAVTWRYQ
jgi:hypothetical protein